ncbi:MAG: 4Fe-4S binding protein, partial [Candidatus Heimdallarchaeota archaeon]
MTRVSTVERKSNIITTERKDRYGVTALILDADKCTGCNLCWTVCPRYAIERGP